MRTHRISKIDRAAAFAVLVSLTAAFLSAAQLPTAKPSEVGLSAERLDRLSRSMQEYVDKGRLPGLVVLAARNGKVVYHKAFGKLDPAAGTPMPIECDLPGRLAEQGHHLHRGHDPAGGGQAPHRRSDSEIHPRVRECPGRRAGPRQGCQGLHDGPLEAGHHDSRPPDAYGGHLLRQRARPRGLGRGRHHRLVPGRQGRSRRRRHPQAGRPAPRRPARRAVHLRLQHRHPGLSGRGRIGDELGRVHRESGSPAPWAWPTPISSCPRPSLAVLLRSTVWTTRAGSSSMESAKDSFYVKGPAQVLCRRRRAAGHGRGLCAVPDDARERRRARRRRASSAPRRSS